MTNATRFLICTDLYPDTDTRERGHQTHAVKDLVESAIQGGMMVVGVLRFNQVISKEIRLKIGISYVGNVKIIDIPIFGYRTRFLSFLSKLFVRKYLPASQYDSVISHMSMSYYRANKILPLNTKRHYLVVHQGDFFQKTLKLSIENNDGVFARSDSIKRKLLDRFGNIEVKGVVYSGIDDKLIEAGRSRNLFDGRYLCSKSKVVKLIFCGALLPLKNVDKIIESLPILHERGVSASLMIVGDGPDLKKLKSLVCNLALGDCVFFTGWRRKEEVFDFLKDSCIYIMPSKPETLGLAYLEAMAMGCLVIGHVGEGIDGIVVDGFNGYLVGAADAVDIANKISRFLSLSDVDKMHVLKRSFEAVSGCTNTKAGLNYFSSFK
ncbi:MAG: glycosyltransferase family 4 protein [Alcanivorax sp.]|nr:glycosyltransferase family 4 protein [Alcanivorax sp.]